VPEGSKASKASYMNMRVHIQVLGSRIASQNWGHFHFEACECQPLFLMSIFHLSGMRYLCTRIILSHPFDSDQPVITMPEESSRRWTVGKQVKDQRGESEGHGTYEQKNALVLLDALGGMADPVCHQRPDDTGHTDGNLIGDCAVRLLAACPPHLG
jgi:hypothetical protein